MGQTSGQELGLRRRAQEGGLRPLKSRASRAWIKRLCGLFLWNKLAWSTASSTLAPRMGERRRLSRRSHGPRGQYPPLDVVRFPGHAPRCPSRLSARTSRHEPGHGIQPSSAAPQLTSLRFGHPVEPARGACLSPVTDPSTRLKTRCLDAPSAQLPHACPPHRGHCSQHSSERGDGKRGLLSREALLHG